MPCRCGHSCTSGPAPRSGTPGSSGARVQHLDASRARSTSLDDDAGLREVRRAGHVGDHPTRPAPRRARRPAARAAARSAGHVLRLRRQRASGRRRSAPSPVHGASTSTRSNDAASTAPRGRRRPAPHAASPRTPGGPGRRGAAARSTATSPPPARPRGRRAAPPCRPGRRTCRATARPALERRAGSAAPTSWLPSSCTPGAAVRTAASGPGSPSGSRTAYGD